MCAHSLPVMGRVASEARRVGKYGLELCGRGLSGARPDALRSGPHFPTLAASPPVPPHYGEGIAVPISGMTGFGRAEGALGAWSWAVEARSVNGRNLEVRFRGPPGFDGLERVAREGAQARFQ